MNGLTSLNITALM